MTDWGAIIAAATGLYAADRAVREQRTDGLPFRRTGPRDIKAVLSRLHELRWSEITGQNRARAQEMWA